MQKAIAFIHRTNHQLGNIACALLLILVLVLAFNVISRYAFNNSSIGLEELGWHLYAAVFLLGIPFALNTGSHVRIDIFYDRFPPKIQAAVDLFGCLLFLIPFCLIVIWSGWQFTSAAYSLGPQPDSMGQFLQQLISDGIGEKSQDPGGLLNRWIIKAVIPFSFLCLLFAGLAFGIESAQKIVDARETVD